MFGGELSDNLFRGIDEFGDFSSRLGYPCLVIVKRRHWPIPLCAHKGLLQEAAQTALKFKRDEVDTEHLLYVISNSEVIKEIYKQFKVNPEEIKNYIEVTHLKAREKQERRSNPAVHFAKSQKRVRTGFSSSSRARHSYIGRNTCSSDLSRKKMAWQGLLRKYGLSPKQSGKKSSSRRQRSSRRARRNASTTPH